jgi:CelD/BcsL family acetyltransferase involved in cellulose biosynthesis
VGLEVHTEIAPIERDWDQLAVETAAAPFLRPGWFSAWWHAFGAGKLVVPAVRREGRLVAVLPLSQRAGVLASPTNWHTPLYGPVAADEPALQTLLDWIVSEHPRRIDLSFLGEGESATDELRRLGDSYRVVERTMLRSPYVEIDGDWEAYWGSVSGKLRQTVRRASKRLGEAGEVRLDIHSGSAQLEELLTEGFELEATGWKGRNGTAIISDPRTRLFYTELARWGAEQGLLRLAFLRVDGRGVAFHLSLESNDRYYLLKPGYDESFRKAGPGTVLTSRMIERAFSERLTAYEFLGADDEHKLKWTDKVRPRLRLQAFASSPTGMLDRMIQTHGRTAAKWVRRSRR